MRNSSIQLTHALALAVLATLAGPVSPAATQARSSIVTDRPSESTGTSVVPTSAFQIESGYKLSEDGETTRQDLPDLLVRIGLAERLEARVIWLGWTTRSRDGTEGANDMSVGAKLVLTDEQGARPAVSLLAETSLPTGSRGLTDDVPTPKVLALFNSTLGKRVSLVYNLGARFPENETRRTTDVVYSSMLTGALTTETAWFAELFGTLAGAGASSQHTVQGGMTRLGGERLQWDARVARTLSSGGGWLFGAGLSFRVF